MPTHSEDESKLARKAVAKASLARAKQWSEDQRRRKSLVPNASTVFDTPSKKDPPANKPAQTHVQNMTPGLVDAAQYRKTPSRVDRAQARAKAREWNSERKKPKPNSKAGGRVPGTVETKLTEDSSDCPDDFKTARTTDCAHEGLSVPAGVFVPESHVKELASIKNDFKKVHKRLEILYDAMDKIGDSDENMNLDN
jgi:hypothetical protein